LTSILLLCTDAHVGNPPIGVILLGYKVNSKFNSGGATSTFNVTILINNVGNWSLKICNKSSRAALTYRLLRTWEEQLNQQMIAFVADTDAFEGTAAGYESIYFSASLHLPSTTSDASIKDIVYNLMKDLQLEERANIHQCKYMSCGERRRLIRLAVELVASLRLGCCVGRCLLLRIRLAVS
jgi:hypothetical protein